MIRKSKNAVLFTEMLRKTGYEAYVSYGQYASIDCIGGYQKPNDSQLPKDMLIYRQMTIIALPLDPQLIPTPRRPNIRNARAGR